MNRRLREGFVLPLTLVFVTVSAIILGSVLGYAAFASRMTQLALGRDRCRFAAQGAIEQAKVDIQEGFNTYLANNLSTILINVRRNKAFNWFNNPGGDHRTVGSPNSVTIFDGLEMPIANNGCRVWVAIRDINHQDDATEATVTLVATAECDLPGGQTARSTILESMLFGTEQSTVFDNAYFVNNYGWMSGNFTINGEFRANGNVSLKNGAVVNGSIYAAPNPEIGAVGTATIGSSSIYDRARYRSNAGSRARYDIGNLDEPGSYDPASSSGSITAASYDDDGNLIGGSRTAVCDKDGNIVYDDDGNPILSDDPIVHQTQTIAGEESTVNPVAMPFISDLSPYVEYAQEEHGTLSCPQVSYTDGAGTTHTTPANTINAHLSVSEAGPSGDTSLADAGSVLLVGTQSNPIRIDGPVVVDGDVIIKGYVTGQGTIYAGRNIHIIGDIKYVNAPSWNHYASSSAAATEQSANDQKDMLGLMAKGNIVIGDATSSTIADTVNGVSESYACDASDASIGYNSTFNGNYAATEKVTVLSSALAATAPGGYDASSGQFGKVRETTTTTYENYTYTDWRGRTRTGTRKVQTVTVENEFNRKYYETCCDDRVIDTFYTASVKQIDAVMYNNHGVFGTLGANFLINGALVCRDEGLSANGGTFNWDMRLRRKSKSQVAEKMGLPKGADEPYVCSWMETTEDMNPLYKILSP